MIKHARFQKHHLIPLGKYRSFVNGCKAHLALAADAATEGTVLLKNDGILPMKAGKIALFGRGAGSGFLFGGGGSGSLYTTGRVGLVDGLKQEGFEVYEPLVDFYTAFVDKETAEKKAAGGTVLTHWMRGYDRPEPVITEELYQGALAFSKTAVYCLPRHSSEGTDFGDRSVEKGSFRLYDEEVAILDRLCADFDKVIVILNVCGPIETGYFKNNPKINAVLYPMFGGHLAGKVLAEILTGKRYPSGHLQDTLAETIEDYPTTATFCESRTYVNYTEDIFVGYRYFETLAPEKVVYPFGFGLSYTTYETAVKEAKLEKNTVKLTVTAKNTGAYKGKEVIQAYLTAPQGKLGKAKKVLCAFQKSKELAPGESQDVKLSFDIREFGSFDDLGKIKESAFILEKGTYTVSVGNNVRDAAGCLDFTLESAINCRQCHAYRAPVDLAERLTADGSYEKLPKAERITHKPKGYTPKQEALEEDISLENAFETDRLDAFLATLSDSDLTELLYGHPDFNAADTNGIGLMRKEKWDVKKVPLVPTADGPAGLRISPRRDNDPNTYFCTGFPVGTVMASMWDTERVQELTTAMGNEVLEYGADVLLAPGMNLHRNPLCGRNFEYFSEDPFLTGKTAAAYINGIQSNGVGVSVKHFAANNQEVNRMENDSRVSQRALRELYLKGFEIAVKESDPWTVMSSYNKLNGEYTQQSHGLLTTILRDEWGFNGIVMTDWGTKQGTVKAVNAGNDLMEPGMQVEIDRIIAAVKAGEISQEQLDKNVRNMLTYIVRTPRFNKYQYSNKPDTKAHAELVRKAAPEGMVLLENNGVLPLKDVKRVALYGTGSYDFIAGGTGSGNVNKPYIRNVAEGLTVNGLEVNQAIQNWYEQYIALAKTELRNNGAGAGGVLQFRPPDAQFPV